MKSLILTLFHWAADLKHGLSLEGYKLSVAALQHITYYSSGDVMDPGSNRRDQLPCFEEWIDFNYVSSL